MAALTDYYVDFYTDGHDQATAGGGLYSTTKVYGGLDLKRERASLAQLASPVRKHIANDATGLFGSNLSTPLFKFYLGDGPFPESSGSPSIDTIHAPTISQWVGWRNNNYHNLRKGSNLFIGGNHESESKQFLCKILSDTDAKQKQCTVARKMVVANPTNTTYSYGGESGSFDDWVPPLNSLRSGFALYDAAFRASHVTATLNDSPLENYYYMKAGNAAFLTVDVYRYSGEPDVSMQFPDPSYWRIGATQKKQLRGALQRCRADGIKWIFIILHTIPGGRYIVDNPVNGFWYGRDSGKLFEYNAANRAYYAAQGVAFPADQKWLWERCLEFGVTALIKGHDHHHCVTLCSNGTKVVTVATCGANQQAQADGDDWHDAISEDGYGTAQSLGQLDHSGAATTGITFTRYCVGMMRLHVTTAACTMDFYQTYIGTDSADTEQLLTQPSFTERFTDVQTRSVTAGSFTLTDSQIQVVGSFDDADVEVADAIWTNGATNRLKQGHTEWSALEALITSGVVRVPKTSIKYRLQYRCSAVTTGISGASEPTWPTTVGSTVVDGGVTWTAERFVPYINAVRTNDPYTTPYTGAVGIVASANATQQSLYYPRRLETVTVNTAPTPVPVRSKVSGSVGSTSGVGGVPVKIGSKGIGG